MTYLSVISYSSTVSVMLLLLKLWMEEMLTKKQRKKGCYHCGSNNHQGKNCPVSSCRLCGKLGHNVGGCPERPEAPVDTGEFLPRTEAPLFTYAELFAGMGGFRVALDKLGGHCVFASEIDRFCVRNYQENFGDRPAGDITRIRGEQIADHDLLVGGFPCQPFSSSGAREGMDDPRGFYFVRFAAFSRRNGRVLFFWRTFEVCCFTTMERR